MNKQFGKLTVLETTGRMDKFGSEFYWCRCACGNITILSQEELERAESIVEEQDADARIRNLQNRRSRKRRRKRIRQNLHQRNHLKRYLSNPLLPDGTDWMVSLQIRNIFVLGRKFIGANIRDATHTSLLAGRLDDYLNPFQRNGFVVK